MDVSFAPKPGIEVAKCLSFISKVWVSISHIAFREVGFGKDIGAMEGAAHNTSHPAITQNLSVAALSIRSHLLNHDHAASLSCLESLSFCITDLKQGGLSL